MLKSLLVTMILLVNIFAQNQNLYIPRNIEDAYFFKTRYYDGKPGESYWINSSDYKINVEVVPATREVFGREVITYYNNSPDELEFIVFRLYQDFYKKGNMRDWQIDSLAVTSGVVISELKINGKKFLSGSSKGEYERYGTNLTVKLSEKLISGSKIEIEVEWSFKIPFLNRLRMGMYDESTFFISFWYPQISVYDDIDGWDENHYKGTTEMYNDFNNYEVNITVPENFIVWATGLLQNADDVLEEKFSKRLQKAGESDEIIRIIDQNDLLEGAITKQNGKNIWKYKAEHVPDFAFALSNHYLWDATSLEVEKDRRVLINAAYNKQSKDFYEVASIARKTIEYLSNDLPGIPYPYPAMSVFNGHGGMEYPMMVNDGSTETRARTVGLTAHEITHTYFPFFMGTNERKYAWMDEGWAVVIPYYFQLREAPEQDPRPRNIETLQKSFGMETDIPPMILNIFLTGNTYRNSVYNRAGTAYYFLRDFLGDDIFKSALKEYIKRWNRKHPIPYDFFFTFNDVTGEDLSWFWKPWFFESGYPDLAIDKVFSYEDSYELFIKKIGSVPVPLKIYITYTDGSKSELYKTAEIWKNGNDEYVVTLDRKKNIKSITIGSELIPDVEQINNEVMVE